MNDTTTHTLLELNNLIQKGIKANFPTTIWVQTEISQLMEKNGHAYLEFVEKEKETDRIVAKSRAICWSNTYTMLKSYFESSTGERLRAGLKIMVAVYIEFNQVYGIGLNIKDINPVFTIGDMANRRMEVIQQLEADGVIDMNKSLTLPKLVQRLAIISSPTAAGYGDFCDQLAQHQAQFCFYQKLFPAIVQGDHAEASILAALDAIYNHIQHFDVVLILRGGGATTDLACFDSYSLALHIAQFPLPVISGIGHQRDVSVVDMVAHTSVKTPTAAAEFVIQQMQTCADELDSFAQRISGVVLQRMHKENTYLVQVQTQVENRVKMWKMEQNFGLNQLVNRLTNSIEQRRQAVHTQFELLTLHINHNNPQRLLEKGYSLTFVNGKKADSIQDVKRGDEVVTYLSDGTLHSRIEKVEKHN